jgi:hypothetical protein
MVGVRRPFGRGVMNRFLPIVAPFVTVCGALPAAPVPRDAGKPPLYFPTRVGTELVYNEIGDQGDEGCIQFVTESTENNGRYTVTVKTTWLGRAKGATSSARYEVSENGIFKLASGAVPDLDPSNCWLKLPARTGDKWGENASDRLPPHVAGEIETVKVPAGTFEAIRVDRGNN